MANYMVWDCHYDKMNISNIRDVVSCDTDISQRLVKSLWRP